MKKLFLTIFTFLIFNITYSQISATTSSGKKVKLYTNGTWEYTSESKQVDDSKCADAKIGKVCFNNNTDQTIYITIRGKGTYKISAGKTKCIEELSAGFDELYKYEYMVKLEEPSNSLDWNTDASKQNGEFLIKVCGTKTIDIEDL